MSGGYTRRPGEAPDRKKNPWAIAAALSVIVALGWGALRPVPAPVPVPVPVPAPASVPAASVVARPAAGAPAPKAATTPPAPAPPAAAARAPRAEGEGAEGERAGPFYLNEGYLEKNLPLDPEEKRDDVDVVIDYFSTERDGYPVAGGYVDALIDGRPVRLALQTSVKPGMTKAVALLPLDDQPHRVDFFPIYDLGPGGLAPVRETMEKDAEGNTKVYTVQTLVDRAVFHLGERRRKIKLKN